MATQTNMNLIITHINPNIPGYLVSRLSINNIITVNGITIN